MLISKINLDTSLLNLINNMIIDDVFLINIFSNGICITQNINSISNLSIFIDKSNIKNHFNNKEISFVINNINILENLLIEKIDNHFEINNEVGIINNPCNVCKKLIKLSFTKTDINYNDLNLSDKINFLRDSNFEIIISDQFNGIVLKTNVENIILYINILYSN
jgi:hypothetical protein